MGQPKLLLLLTGGTLAMEVGEGGALEPSAFASRLAAALPETDRIASVETASLMAKDSSDIGPADWTAIASALRERYTAYDGFVVVHGTDTMAYTASAISFMLPSSSKPVVFTGSQRPLREPRSDARVNLVDALTVATLPVPEVTVCFHSQLLRGNRCRKRSTAAYAAFESPNFPPLGELGVGVELLESEILAPRGVPGLPLPRPLPLEERVAVLHWTPATRAAEIEAHAGLGTRGLVLLAFGSGNLPVRPDLLAALRRLAVPFVVLSQCWHGPVELSLYPGGKALADLGALDGGDMTPEAALTKLMAGLGLALPESELRRYMLSSVSGERRPAV